ncbi:hypothetical protein BOTBODRAFT_38549 [Botryobasidium botryosum FD-172 SS1]|uniref:Pentacotripeptide-repeat region of PRORP domain-containing protein n=1 Tax=Botryobasidium botryosum (strain FD-172 SS1) TaxID=930990 RepID=A0A067M854_BOTB1|nr:hypothetical protein BOTBODRAFT_38549 [Botryobasidium botryosum FD-172 SS1]
MSLLSRLFSRGPIPSSRLPVHLYPCIPGFLTPRRSLSSAIPRPLPSRTTSALPHAPTVKSFFRGIQDSLERRKDGEEALRFFQEGVSRLPYSTRLSCYERAIHLFARHQQAWGATQVYRRLIREGYLPSPAATTLVLRLTHDPKEIEALMQRIVEGPIRMDEATLCTFLAKLVPNKNPELMRHILARFIKWHMSDGGSRILSAATFSVMINGYGHAGDFSTAFQWLEQYRKQCGRTSDSSDATAINPSPYATLMSCLADHEPDDQTRLFAVLRLFESDGGIPDIVLWNIILAAASRITSHSTDSTRVIALYRLMRRKYPQIRADGYTFGVLLKAQERSHRKVHPTTRHIFRHMVEAHLAHTKGRPSLPSSFLTTSLLNLTLQTLIRTRDYAGATVVLRTFPVCKIQPDKATYWAVVRPLLRRMRGEVKHLSGARETSWLERLLGWTVVSERHGYQSAVAGRRVIDALLENTNSWSPIPALSAFQAAGPAELASFLEAPHCFTPPPAPTPARTLRPLMDLLRRCILADAGLSSRTSPDLQKATVAHAMANANEDMLPAKKRPKSTRKKC